MPKKKQNRMLVRLEHSISINDLDELSIQEAIETLKEWEECALNKYLVEFPEHDHSTAEVRLFKEYTYYDWVVVVYSPITKEEISRQRKENKKNKEKIEQTILESERAEYERLKKKFGE